MDDGRTARFFVPPAGASDPMRFAIVEYPDTTLGTVLLASRPGASLDAMLEAPTGPPGDLRYACIALARGFDPEGLRTLVTGLQHKYDDLQTLSMEPRAGRWLGRFTVRERALAGTASLRIVRFQHKFGAAWAHSEAGVIHLRVRLRDGVDGDALVAAMQEDLAQGGIDAQVEVRELGPRDYSVWDELVQAAIGLRP